MIVVLLSITLFQYLKCQDQRISKNCRSTFIFCSSWNPRGMPIFYIQLATGGGEHLCTPRLLRHCLRCSALETNAHSAWL